MSVFPTRGLKPFYDELKAWLFTSHNADGTLRGDVLADMPISTATSLALATKANQTALDATNTTVATKAAQSDMIAAQADIATKADAAATTTALATKAAQTALDATNTTVSSVSTVANRADDRVFDIRKYGATTALADNITAINAAATAANAAGGGEVLVPDGVWLVRPSSTSWIKLGSNTTLRLTPGATIKVGNDVGNYPTVIGAATISTHVDRVTIRGGAIDNNASGNTTSTIATGDANKICASIQFGNFDGVMVDGVKVSGVGVNSILLSGLGCKNAYVIESDVSWSRGASPAAYDNSAIYINVREGGHVVSNTGRATVSTTQPGNGFCEAHGNNIVVAQNIVDGFQTLCNIVTESNVADTRATNGIKVLGNIHTNGNNSISLWSITAYTLRGVQVTDNFISLAQVDHNQRTCWGILFYRSVTLNGAYDGVNVSHNTIRFQAGDARTTNYAGTALDTAGVCGIGLNPFGNISNVNLDHNTIHDAPAYGILLGIVSDATYTITRVHGRSNKLINCGRNASLSTAVRAGLALYGQLTKVDFDDTLFVDDGSPSTNGANSLLASTGLTSGSQCWMRNSRYQITSSTPLTSTINRSKVTDYYGSATLDFPSVAAGGTQSLTISVPGVTSADVVAISTLSAVTAGIVLMPPIAGTDIVTVVAMNPTAAAIDPGAVIVRVQVVGGQIR